MKKVIKVKKVKRLKSWCENLLTGILGLCLILMACVNDTTSLIGLLIYEVVLAFISFLIIVILGKYGRS
jgi:hypothetical protein